MDGPSTSSRSAFYQQKTNLRRGTQQYHPPNGSKLNDEPRANDHALPNKKFKSTHPAKPGISSASASAVKSTNGQDISDSSDELGLSPPSNDGTRTLARSQRHQIQNRRNRAVTGMQQVISVEIPNHVSPSPENEEDFTKNSARLRKAEKDDIIGNSSPNPKEEHSEQTVSPYIDRPEVISFTRRKIQRQDEQRILVDESVDNVRPNSRSSSTTPYKKLRGHEILDRLIHGNAQSTNISQPAKSRPKKLSSKPSSFSLKEVVCSSLDNSDAYVVQVDPASKQLCINLENCLLSQDPVLMPFPINKIVQFRYDKECLVNIGFSRSGESTQTLYLRFSSKESATAFIRLLREITSSFNLQTRDQ